MQSPNSWSDYVRCQVCKRQFDFQRPPASLVCGHSLCRPCTKHLQRGVCPLEKSPLDMDVAKMPVNVALLAIAVRDSDSSKDSQPSPSSSVQQQFEDLERSQGDVLRESLGTDEYDSYLLASKELRKLSEFMHPADAQASVGGNSSSSGSVGSAPEPASQANNGGSYWPKLSRPMHKKLAGLIQCQLLHPDGRVKLMRNARSVGERVCMELLLLHQNQASLVHDLWQAVKNCGGQFLGHPLQEQILKNVFLLTSPQPRHALQRKTLVEFVVQRLERDYPIVSKTNVGHVVQLMYRASCFHVTKKAGEDVSQLLLHEDIHNYGDFRTKHDIQIAQIAMEKGLYITPEYFSHLLFGTSTKRAHMQSIMDKLITNEYFRESIEKVVLTAASQDNESASRISLLRPKFDVLEQVTRLKNDKEDSRTVGEAGQVLEAVVSVLTELVNHPKYKVWIENGRKGKSSAKSKNQVTGRPTRSSDADDSQLLRRGGSGHPGYDHSQSGESRSRDGMSSGGSGGGYAESPVPTHNTYERHDLSTTISSHYSEEGHFDPSQLIPRGAPPRHGGERISTIPQSYPVDAQSYAVDPQGQPASASAAYRHPDAHSHAAMAATAGGRTHGGSVPQQQHGHVMMQGAGGAGRAMEFSPASVDGQSMYQQSTGHGGTAMHDMSMVSAHPSATAAASYPDHGQYSQPPQHVHCHSPMPGTLWQPPPMAESSGMYGTAAGSLHPHASRGYSTLADHHSQATLSDMQAHHHAAATPDHMMTAQQQQYIHMQTHRHQPPQQHQHHHQYQQHGPTLAYNTAAEDSGMAHGAGQFYQSPPSIGIAPHPGSAAGGGGVYQDPRHAGVQAGDSGDVIPGFRYLKL